MDIARISNTAYPAPAYPVASRNRERVLDLVADIDAAAKLREPAERVVQGEVLQRQRTAYSSTRDYLGSRLFDGTYVADGEAAGPQRRAGHAVGAYLSHTRELIQPDVNRGKQVDYFI